MRMTMQYKGSMWNATTQSLVMPTHLLHPQRHPQPPPSDVSSNLLAVRCGIACCNHVARLSSFIRPRCMYCLCPRLYSLLSGVITSKEES